MAQGTVKWFNATKGVGVIRPNAGDGLVFVRKEDVAPAAQQMSKGEKVTFEPRSTASGNVVAHSVQLDKS